MKSARELLRNNTENKIIIPKTLQNDINYTQVIIYIAYL
jgi:hypothetical protein